MCFGLCISGAAADGKAQEDSPKYEKMVFFGDSVGECWGWHLDKSKYHDTPKDTDAFYFPKTVAEGLGIEGFGAVNCYASSGLRSTDILALLTDGYGSDNVFEQGYLKCMSDWGSSDMFKDVQKSNVRENYQQQVKDAGLVVLELGTNDILSYAQELSGLVKIAADFGALADMNKLTSFLSDYAKYTAEGYANFLRDYPELIKRIKELHEDADIVIIGVFNPLSQMTVVEENVLPIGNIIAPLTMSMNACLKNWAEEYGCTFVDISNVELGYVHGYGLLSGDSNEMALATHPSFRDGYDYIARQVLNAIQEEKKADFTIRVDLGNVEKVSLVSLDGRKLSPAAYSFEDHVLTIPNAGTFNDILAVTGLKGKMVYVNTYTLSYDAQNGYTAHLLYSTPDLIGTLSTLMKGVFSVFSLIFKN